MRRLSGLVLALVGLLLLFGCGGDSKNSKDLAQLKEDNAPYDPSVPNVKPVGTLGELDDLGDLLADSDPSEPGDHWYYTRAGKINDDGIIIGQSMQEAFVWNPETGLMTPLVDSAHSEAIDINNSGVIIGNILSGNNLEDKTAFMWASGEAINIPPVSGDFSETVDINENGEIIFNSSDSAGTHAYHININAISGSEGVVDYLPIGHIVSEDSFAVAINENGQSVVNSGGTVVFFDENWGALGTLNHLPGATRTEAVDINDSRYTNNDNIPDGHVIGNSGNGTLKIGEDESVRGFFWDGGAMYPVDDLGGGSSVTTDINNQDQVVGGAMTEEGNVHAYIWTLGPDKKGMIRDLGTLGGDNGFATAINEAGDVVGWSETGAMYQEQGVVTPIRHAFLWRKGVMYDLGTHNYFYDYPFVPSFPYSEAVDVNASGDVAGNSITINNHSRGFFLRPTFP